MDRCHRTGITSSMQTSASFINLIMAIFVWGNEFAGAAYAWDRALQESMLGVAVPPILATRVSPLDDFTAAKLVEQLKSGPGPGNYSALCDEAGLLCDQRIDVVPVLLYSFGSYFQPSGRNPSKSFKGIKLRMFFGERKLRLGNRIRLSKQHKPVPGRAFLPRALAGELPLRSQGLPQLLRLFGFSNSSHMADSMAETLSICEADPRDDEVKTCVASLEDMVDFAVSVLGSRGLEILVGDLMPAGEATVRSVVEMKNAWRGTVACHNAMFPYQVFYCHYLLGSKVFRVELETNGGKLISAVASCHHEAKLGKLQNELWAELKVQRGELICHWNYGDNVVWIPSLSVLPAT